MNKNIFNQNLALFVGAGASIAPPSSLPSFYQLRDFITSSLFDNIPKIGIDYTFNIQTKPELLLQIIWEYFGIKVNPINGFKYASPNKNHYLISNICKNGVRFIITTNFDQCIEKALSDSNLEYHVYHKSPSNDTELNELKQLIKDEDKILIWKPHGDCCHTETLCYTIEQVARLNVSKFLKSIYEYILDNFNLLTLGYSGYDDDLFPILLDFPRTNKVKNRIYWNAFSKVEPNTPPYNLQKTWGKNIQILLGDIQTILANFKSEHSNSVLDITENNGYFWKKEIKSEIAKIQTDWTYTVLGQYFHRLQLFQEARSLWKYGLEDMNLSNVNKLRFDLNLLLENDLERLKTIYNNSLQLNEYKISNISLSRIITCLNNSGMYYESRLYLRKYKTLINSYPTYFTYADYVKSVKDYLVAKYKRCNRRINILENAITLNSYDLSKTNGDIIGAINALNSYIASLAENNEKDPIRFKQILDYISILEAYNIPSDLASLYFTISMYASRIGDKILGLKYIDMCLLKLETCYANKVYNPDNYLELKAYILHQKSMFGTAKDAISLCEEAIVNIKTIKDFKEVSNSLEYFLGVYNSSIASNYLVLGKNAKASEYAEIALTNHIKAKDDRGEARTLITYGEILLIDGKKEKAMKAFHESYKKHLFVGENTNKIENTLKRLKLENLIIQKPTPNK
jgi:hypothetical protein